MSSKLSALVAVLAVSALPAVAAEHSHGAGAPYLTHAWDFDGPFGKYDQAALQRGWQVYESVCSNCHALKQLSFRNLGQKGGPFDVAVCKAKATGKPIRCENPNDNPIVKTIAAKYKFKIDDLDDSGVPVQRAAIPADRIPSPFANDLAARAANGGALPPDLSLIIKARHNGANYVHSLLNGYRDAPEAVKLSTGQHYNIYFGGDMRQLMKPEMMENGEPKAGVEVPIGGVLAMPPPLSEGIVEYADKETPQTIEQYSRDVVEFLAWASEPKMEQRKSLGVMALIYLVILAGVLYASSRAIWSKAH